MIDSLIIHKGAWKQQKSHFLRLTIWNCICSQVRKEPTRIHCVWNVERSRLESHGEPQSVRGSLPGVHDPAVVNAPLSGRPTISHGDLPTSQGWRPEGYHQLRPDGSWGDGWRRQDRLQARGGGYEAFETAGWRRERLLLLPGRLWIRSVNKSEKRSELDLSFKNIYYIPTSIRIESVRFIETTKII